MRSAQDFAKVFIHLEPIDFRKWIDGLAAIVQTNITLAPHDSYLFVFTNRHRDRIKTLYWDRTGYAIWFKRLEEQHFVWPKNSDGQVLEVTPQQFEWLLDGYDISRMRPHETLRYAASF